jgi:hypothetical protein
MADDAIDLDLPALDDLGRVALKLGVQIDAAVAVGLALETQREIEIRITLLGDEVAVLGGDAFSLDRAVFDDPLFLADIFPAGQVFAVEERLPLRTESFWAIALSLQGSCAKQTKECEAGADVTSDFHGRLQGASSHGADSSRR